ncbi:MAG: ATP-binding protein [Flavitalea sp.]
MQDQTTNLILFVTVTTSLMLLLASFIITILYLYQKKHFLFQNNLEKIKIEHEKNILRSQLEIQEQTFTDVSRDIHDNISLSLTLAKLHLNNINLKDDLNFNKKINVAITLIGEAIYDLNNISKSLNADIIKNHGLLNAIENELDMLMKTDLYEIKYDITGSPVFMSSEKELILFRIIQEAINNIIKHSKAEKITLFIKYNIDRMELLIEDNGIGFSTIKFQEEIPLRITAGLNNIRQRAKMLNSECFIDSAINKGTIVKISIPY